MHADAPLLISRQLRSVQDASTALDLELHAGHIMAIIGPHDSGKTALLQTLAGLRRPAAGELRILGEDVANLRPSDQQALRARLGFVSISAPLLSNFNARLNVMLPRLYHQRENMAAAEQAANLLLDKLQFRGNRMALPAHLGHLDRWQLLLARALVMEPAMLFLDEPFRLDLAHTWNTIGSMLAGIARVELRTLILVTHNLFFVAEHADEILFINNSNISRFHGWQELLASDRAEVQEFLRDVPTRPGENVA